MRVRGRASAAAVMLIGAPVALIGCADLAAPASTTASAASTAAASPTGTSAGNATSPASVTSATNAAGSASAAGASAASKLGQAEATHEYPSSHVQLQRAASPAPSAAAAIRAFATAYINWTAPTVSADMRVLAAASIGQARSAMQLAAANTAQDYELRRGGIANSGEVEAIAPLAGAHDQYVVVTRERTTASDTAIYQGLRAAWHLTLATVSRVGGKGWALSGWQPQN